MNGATGKYQESLWPPVGALRDTALVLVALLLVDRDLALLMAGVLILAWGVAERSRRAGLRIPWPRR